MTERKDAGDERQVAREMSGTSAAGFEWLKTQGCRLRRSLGMSHPPVA